MYEPIEDYARRVGHTPLLRFIESSREIHAALGIDTELVEYDSTAETLRASLMISKLHTGTVYNTNAIMYGIVIAAFTDMVTGAAAYLRAGSANVVNHKETRIKYIDHVHIKEGTRLFAEVIIYKIKRVKRFYYCMTNITQVRADETHMPVAEAWTKIASLAEKIFERLLKSPR